jgi:transposase-like protein
METFEVIHIGVSPGRSDLDALLFIKQVLKHCRGDPVVLVDRGPWYNWPLDDFDLSVSHAEKRGGERSLVEAWFGLLKYQTRLFYNRFFHYSSWQSVDRWVKAFATFHNAIIYLDTLYASLHKRAIKRIVFASSLPKPGYVL